jgi:serine/threonine-protein kinase
MHGLVGTLLQSRYRVEQRIAVGSMGHVFRAVDELLSREVAVKVLDVTATPRTATLHERFRREVRTLAALSHPHIVSIYDTGVTPDRRPFLVMELLRGPTLAQRIDEGQRLEVEQVFQVAAQLARALKRAHSHGVVHRDIKPANIVVVDDEDGELFVKLLDFGVARLFDPEAEDPSEDATHLTNQGALVGSPLYMSPEQIVGDKIDPRSDIYSLGVTLYQLLTGRTPYLADSPIEAIRYHLHGTIAPIREVAPEINQPELEQVILRCVNRLPDERYASISELFRDLRRAYAAFTQRDADLSALHGRVRWDSEVVEPMVAGQGVRLFEIPPGQTPVDPLPLPFAESIDLRPTDLPPAPPRHGFAPPWWAWGLAALFGVAAGAIAGWWIAGS